MFVMEFLTTLAKYFSEVLNTSITAGIVVVCVLIARLFLKKAPKIFSYALWGIVLLRLLIPSVPESPVSIVPDVPELMQVQIDNTLPDITFESYSDRQENQLNQQQHKPGEVLVQVYHNASATTYITLLWLVGILAMLLYSVIVFLQLRRKLRTALPAEKRIYIAEGIRSAFVIGLLCPKIYLPSTLTQKEKEYILHHERHHIKRCDHIIKALSFLILCIHWFNPLVWIAFILSGKDMEMSCDEAVIRHFGRDIRADYCTSLLNTATQQHLYSGIPLAFGEGDPKGRIRNLVKWKKPATWVILLAILLCIILMVCLITDPPSEIPTKEQVYQALADKNSILDTGILGVPRQSLWNAWGEPVWELFGMWGEIWEIKGAGNIIVYFDSNGLVETVKLQYPEPIDQGYPSEASVSQKNDALTEDPQALVWRVKPMFYVNFAENYSLGQTLTISDRAPYWTIYVFNTGSDTIKMELNGEVFTVSAKTKAVFNGRNDWPSGTYPVSFSTNGAYPMEGIAVCIVSEEPYREDPDYYLPTLETNDINGFTWDNVTADLLAEVFEDVMALVTESQEHANHQVTVPAAIHSAYFMNVPDSNEPFQDTRLGCSFTNQLVVAANYTSYDHDTDTEELHWEIWMLPNFSRNANGIITYQRDNVHPPTQPRATLNHIENWLRAYYPTVFTTKLDIPEYVH